MSICAYRHSSYILLLYKGASLLILANKQDLGGAMVFNQIATILDLHNENISGNRHWKILGCSAIEGTGLDVGIDWVVRDISGRIFLMN